MGVRRSNNAMPVIGNGAHDATRNLPTCNALNNHRHLIECSRALHVARYQLSSSVILTTKASPPPAYGWIGFFVGKSVEWVTRQAATASGCARGKGGNVNATAVAASAMAVELRYSQR